MSYAVEISKTCGDVTIKVRVEGTDAIATRIMCEDLIERMVSGEGSDEPDHVVIGRPGQLGTWKEFIFEPDVVGPNNPTKGGSP